MALNAPGIVHESEPPNSVPADSDLARRFIELLTHDCITRFVAIYLRNDCVGANEGKTAFVLQYVGMELCGELRVALISPQMPAQVRVLVLDRTLGRGWIAAADSAYAFLETVNPF